MGSAFYRVSEIAISEGGAKRLRVSSNAALDQDLDIYGDAAEDVLEGLEKEFGEWVLGWPWHRFIYLSEVVPFSSSLECLWRRLRLPWLTPLFPRTRLERLELGHIAAVIDKGEWFEP